MKIKASSKPDFDERRRSLEFDLEIYVNGVMAGQVRLTHAVVKNNSYVFDREPFDPHCCVVNLAVQTTSPLLHARGIGEKAQIWADGVAHADPQKGRYRVVAVFGVYAGGRVVDGRGGIRVQTDLVVSSACAQTNNGVAAAKPPLVLQLRKVELGVEAGIASRRQRCAGDVQVVGNGTRVAAFVLVIVEGQALGVEDHDVGFDTRNRFHA